MSRHLLPYLGTMLLVTLLIAFVPALVFLLPDLLGLHGR
jgi:TRAP-type C4-dicarboxylate transport system permease large subunit